MEKDEYVFDMLILGGPGKSLKKYFTPVLPDEALTENETEKNKDKNTGGKTNE